MSRDDLESTNEGVGSAGSGAAARELDQQMAVYLRLGLPAATLICAIVGGVLQGASAVVLVIAAGALVSVIAIFWASIRTLVGETPLSGADAYVLGAPRAEEERKRAVLRALKDVEFERSVGKISEEDYKVLVTKYRAEAKRLLRILADEAQPGRNKVEALVRERLFHEGLAERPQGGPYRERKAATKSKKRKVKDGRAVEVEAPPALLDETNVADAMPPQEHENDADTRVACASCGTRNDADAVFCKKCGARRGAAEDSSHEEESAAAGQKVNPEEVS